MDPRRRHPQPPAGRPRLRRAAGLVAAVAIGLVAVVGLISVFNARDEADVAPRGDGAAAPGQAVAGPQLDPAQEQLLRRGNVIVVYGARRPPAALVALRDRLSGPPDPALTAAGQAVLLQRRAGVDGVEAHAWRRVLRTRDPADPRLAAFAERWLGLGDG